MAGERAARIRALMDDDGLTVDDTPGEALRAVLTETRALTRTALVRTGDALVAVLDWLIGYHR